MIVRQFFSTNPRPQLRQKILLRTALFPNHNQAQSMVEDKKHLLEDAANDSPAVKRAKTELPTEPNWTLYVKNVNDKLPVQKLKEQLYILFATYGDVIAIDTGFKGPTRRGQAWVSFGSAEDAEMALKSLQNSTFFGKPLSIQFAKTTSNAITILQGQTVKSSQ